MESLMTLVIWVVLGLGIGALAKFLMPGPDHGGWLVTSLLGISGAVLGGWVASAVGLAAHTGFSLSGLFIAVFGAMALLTVYRVVRKAT